MMNTTLKDLKLHKDDCGYYLDATWTEENDRAIVEMRVPKIRLRLRNAPSIEHEIYFDKDLYMPTTIEFGLGPLVIEKDEDDVCYTVNVIKEKIHEMTMDELEKKLGYKIKIVNKK